MVLAWENLQEVFVMLVVVVAFTSLEVFTFPGYFSLPPALHPGFSGPWRPPPALSSTLATFGCFTFCQVFSSHFYRERYGFEWEFFTRRRFFTLHSFPTFLARFYDWDTGRNTPSRILLCAYPHRVLSSGWRMDLNYSYKSHGKTIKTLWTRLDQKYCLKLINKYSSY